jgi:hypothetical protein
VPVHAQRANAHLHHIIRRVHSILQLAFGGQHLLAQGTDDVVRVDKPNSLRAQGLDVPVVQKHGMPAERMEIDPSDGAVHGIRQQQLLRGQLGLRRAAATRQHTGQPQQAHQPAPRRPTNGRE